MVAQTLSEPLRAKLSALIKERGIYNVRDTLKVGREPLARACAGMPVRSGTIALIEKFFEKREK